MSVQLSSWACQSGAWFSDDCQTTPGATFTTPITLNIYTASSTNSTTGETMPGPLLATVTKTFTIPYRPSASSLCTGPQAGEWFKNGQGCFNGLAHTIGFTLAGLKIRRRDVVWGVSYNSDNSGSNPLGGTNSPTDSLTSASRRRFARAAPPPDGNSGPFVTGVFNLDGPCEGANNSWTGFVPAAEFNAVS